MATIDKLLVEQFFRTELTATVGVNDPTISVADSSGFPEPVNDEYFYLTLVTGDVAEIIKIRTNDVGSGTLTKFDSVPLSQVFPRDDTRVEHWFTAQAFEDIQEYLAGITLAGYPGTDGSTIISGGNPLRVGTINKTHVSRTAGERLENDQIADGAIRDEHIPVGEIDPDKLSGAVESVTRGAVRDAVVRTGDTNTAGLNFLHIAYTDQPIDDAPPSGAAEGDLIIEFEDP